MEISSRETGRSSFLREISRAERIQSCPKCHAPISPVASSQMPACESCGLIFRRFYSQLEDRFEADYRIHGLTEPIEAWQKVLRNYDESAAHDEFLTLCQKLNSLEFAAQKYRRLNEVINDDLAQAQLAKIEALVMFAFERSSPTQPFARLPRVHLWLFVFGGFFIFLAQGPPLWHAVAICGLIFTAGLWAIRLITESSAF